MNRIKRFSQAALGAISGAFAGFLIYAFTGLISGMQWGVPIGLFIGLISVLTGGGLSGFLNALISSILFTGLIGAVLSGLFGVVGGGFIGSTWGLQENATSEEPEVTRSESDRATLVGGSTINSVVKEGLTEKILFAFDPRKPLGRRRFIAYNILYFIFYFVVTFLMVFLLKHEDPALAVNAPWFKFGVANVLIIPHWLLCLRRAVAAKIPVQSVYAFMSWLFIFMPICEVTIGDTLAKLFVVPSLILAFGLLFKRNRLELPYPTA